MTSQPQEQAAAPLNPAVVTVVQPAPPTPSYASRVPPKVLRAHRILGILQVVIGSLDLIYNIVSLIVTGDRRFLLAGCGSGIWFIIAGICGLVASRGLRNTLCCVNACLVLSIISSLTAFSGIFAEAVKATYPRSYGIVYKMWIPRVLLFGLELVVSIVHSAYACRASCCCVPQPESVQQRPQVYITNRSGQEQEVTYQLKKASGSQAKYPRVTYQQVGGAPTNEHDGGPPTYATAAAEKA